VEGSLLTVDAIDEASRFVVVFPLICEAEAPEELIELFTQLELQGRKVYVTWSHIVAPQSRGPPGCFTQQLQCNVPNKASMLLTATTVGSHVHVNLVVKIRF
jgi:hypothetical protein